jgi:ABC-type sugar transport system ATPase subunit
MSAEPTPSGIEIHDLVKTYGDTVALGGLTLQARPGEILGVAGPNGAGKSTMVKILARETQQDSGSITLDGVPWSADKDSHRVAIVHQEPQLFPNLTVAENLLVGAEPSRFNRPKGRDANTEVLQEVGLLEYANATVDSLPLALQQRTEIAKALAKNADVFLFDEPNSALTENESAELFDRMHTLASQGKVVVLVSHRLAELATHCDRIVVIVDGCVRTELAPPDIDEERIARELVVGRSGASAAERAARDADVPTLLRLGQWTHRRARFADIDLDVATGEILAVVGVEGSGGRELVRSMAGFESARGTLKLGSRSGSAAQSQVAYVAGDRSESLFDNLSVGENLFLREAGRLTTRSWTLNRRAARRRAAESQKAFLVKTASLDTPIRSLSGGNQQKVAIASALAIRPILVALEEPTRGVDLGSKAEIYRLLRDYSDAGAAVVMYCTEDSEVFDAADRVIVLSRGRIVGSLLIAGYTDAESLAEAIASLAGSDAPHHHHSDPHPEDTAA